MVPHIYFGSELYIGKGGFMTLKYIEEENFLIFVSEVVKHFENYSKIEKYMEGKSYTEEIIENSTEEIILEMRNKYKNSKLDVIVAVGGGSVIDVAKITKFLLENPEHDLETLRKEWYNQNQKIKLVAVPTTPTTGSEATYTALLKNNQNEKVAYVNRSFIPDIAILDVNFLVSIPLEKLIPMTADIFGHAFEGYFSRVSNVITKTHAISSIKFLKEGIAGLKKNEKDLKSLEKILIAGYFGGVAVGNAFVGACHALAHTAESKIDRGHSNLILNLIKPTLTWHQKQTENADYGKFLKDYEEIGYEKYVESGIFDGLDADWWANAAAKDPAIKTNSVRMKVDAVLELVNWIKTK